MRNKPHRRCRSVFCVSALMGAIISIFERSKERGKLMKLSDRFFLPEDIQPLAKELDGASERAVALLAGAIVDEALLGVIKLRLIEDKEAEKEFFSGQGGLATFSSRIKMARLMNFYGHETYSDLNIMKKIRNDAAHTTRPFSFKDQPHVNRALSLKIPEKHIFEMGAQTDDDLAALFVDGVDEVKADPLLRYVGSAVFLAWNFTAWVSHKPEHLRPQRQKNCPI